MAREVRIERRGKAGLDAAEKLYVTRDPATGERLLPAPTGEALNAKLESQVQSAIDQFAADQEQLQALADILVPSGATTTFRDTDNLMMLGDML